MCNDLAFAINCNKHLSSFCMHGNTFDHSMIKILNSLYNDSSLKQLSLFGNSISENTGHVLSFILMNNCKLEYLQLNLLMSPLKIIKSLQHHAMLEVITFDSISMSKEAEVQLASVITNNKSLRNFKGVARLS